MTTDERRPVNLEATAARQQQIVTRAQLVRAGVNDMVIYRRVRGGRWQRVLPGTYALVSGTLTDEQRRIAAALYAGRGAQLTGLAALAWYGFRYAPPTDKVQLIIPHQTRRRSAGYAAITRALTLDVHARAAGLYQVCSPARSVVDAGRELRDLRAIRAIVAEAIQRRFTSLHALDKEVRRAGRSRTALIRRAHAEVVDGVRSSPEAELRACLADSRLLPAMLWNPLLYGPQGESLPTPDGWLPDAAIAIEVDSREFHFTPEGWARTLDRHNELSRYGVLILHFTPAQIRSRPQWVRRVVEEAYESRRGFGDACPVLIRAPSPTESDWKGPFLTA